MYTLLAEWENEAKLTRKILERVPQDRLAWKPHPKSTSLGGLAMHIANIPYWAQGVLTQQEYVLDGSRLPEPKTTQEILDHFDRQSARFLELLNEKADMDVMWTLKSQGHTIFTAPRGGVARSFLLSHLIHHRGQLSVYLRLLDVPVPGLYGPSADEA